jgi:hypothetical protein
MEEYLGSFPIHQNQTKYAAYTQIDWAMYYIERYGQINGEHHKTWVLDQVSRILKGTPIIIKEARWSNGQIELRISTGEPSIEYNKWVNNMLGLYDPINDEHEYNYDMGIAP